MEAQITVLSTRHSTAKKLFNSGIQSLDAYLQQYALQDQKRLQSVCFILENEQGEIFGYYTLSASAIDTERLDHQTLLMLGAKYKQLPAILIGRFAIDQAYQDKGIGKLLLMDALKHCTKQAEEMGACAVFVDPIDERARHFYLNFGFRALPQQPKLFIPIKTLQALFNAFH
jgi:GNAT superfamily N-acetyltransferase